MRFEKLERFGKLRVLCHFEVEELAFCDAMADKLTERAGDYIGDARDIRMRGVMGEYAVAAYYGALAALDWSWTDKEVLSDGGVDLVLGGKTVNVKAMQWWAREKPWFVMFVRDDPMQPPTSDVFMAVCASAEDGLAEIVGWCELRRVLNSPLRDYEKPCRAVPLSELREVRWYGESGRQSEDAV